MLLTRLGAPWIEIGTSGMHWDRDRRGEAVQGRRYETGAMGEIFNEMDLGGEITGFESNFSLLVIRAQGNRQFKNL